MIQYIVKKTSECTIVLICTGILQQVGRLAPMIGSIEDYNIEISSNFAKSIRHKCATAFDSMLPEVHRCVFDGFRVYVYRCYLLRPRSTSIHRDQSASAANLEDILACEIRKIVNHELPRPVIGWRPYTWLNDDRHTSQFNLIILFVRTHLLQSRLRCTVQFVRSHAVHPVLFSTEPIGIFSQMFGLSTPAIPMLLGPRVLEDKCLRAPFLVVLKQSGAEHCKQFLTVYRNSARILLDPLKRFEVTFAYIRFACEVRPSTNYKSLKSII